MDEQKAQERFTQFLRALDGLDVSAAPALSASTTFGERLSR